MKPYREINEVVWLERFQNSKAGCREILLNVLEHKSLRLNEK